MDGLLEDAINRYAMDLDAGIRQLREAAENRRLRIAGVRYFLYEWMLVGFVVGLLLPSILLRYLGVGETKLYFRLEGFLLDC